jgi:hypothetical protein
MTKPKADTLYQCIESFVAAGEPDTPSYARGIRLYGSHPAIKRYPMYFVVDGTPDDEIHRIRTRLWVDAGAAGGPQ